MSREIKSLVAFDVTRSEEVGTVVDRCYRLHLTQRAGDGSDLEYVDVPWASSKPSVGDVRIVHMQSIDDSGNVVVDGAWSASRGGFLFVTHLGEVIWDPVDDERPS